MKILINFIIVGVNNSQFICERANSEAFLQSKYRGVGYFDGRKYREESIIGSRRRLYSEFSVKRWVKTLFCYDC